MADMIEGLRAAFRKDFTQLRAALRAERQFYLDGFLAALPAVLEIGDLAVLAEVGARIAALENELRESETDD